MWHDFLAIALTVGIVEGLLRIMERKGKK